MLADAPVPAVASAEQVPVREGQQDLGAVGSRPRQGAERARHVGVAQRGEMGQDGRGRVHGRGSEEPLDHDRLADHDRIIRLVNAHRALAAGLRRTPQRTQPEIIRNRLHPGQRLDERFRRAVADPREMPCPT